MESNSTKPRMSMNDIMERFKPKTFRVMFRTLGTTFFAGEYKAMSIDGGKYNASNLLHIRHIRRLEHAEIQDTTGKTMAVLRMQRYPREYEWITIRENTK